MVILRSVDIAVHGEELVKGLGTDFEAFEGYDKILIGYGVVLTARTAVSV